MYAYTQAGLTSKKPVGATQHGVYLRDHGVCADFHADCTSVYINVTTPPAGAIDPREVGVRPTGTYWGSGGEQIDK